MQAFRTPILDADGVPIEGSRSLLWGNNAAANCLACGELVGNRTGDREYRFTCCDVWYEILRDVNKSGTQDLGRADWLKAMNWRNGAIDPEIIVPRQPASFWRFPARDSA